MSDDRLAKAEAEAAELRKKLENETGTLQARLADANHWREINLSRASRAEAGRDAAIAAKEQAERERDRLAEELRSTRENFDALARDKVAVEKLVDFNRWAYQETAAARDKAVYLLAAKEDALAAKDAALRKMTKTAKEASDLLGECDCDLSVGGHEPRCEAIEKLRCLLPKSRCSDCGRPWRPGATGCFSPLGDDDCDGHEVVEDAALAAKEQAERERDELKMLKGPTGICETCQAKAIAALTAKDAALRHVWGMLKCVEVNLQHPWPDGFDHFAAFFLPKIQYALADKNLRAALAQPARGVGEEERHG